MLDCSIKHNSFIIGYNSYSSFNCCICRIDMDSINYFL